MSLTDPLFPFMNQRVSATSPLFGEITGILTTIGKTNVVLKSHSVLQCEVTIPREWVTGLAKDEEVKEADRENGELPLTQYLREKGMPTQ